MKSNAFGKVRGVNMVIPFNNRIRTDNFVEFSGKLDGKLGLLIGLRSTWELEVCLDNNSELEIVRTIPVRTLLQSTDSEELLQYCTSGEGILSEASELECILVIYIYLVKLLEMISIGYTSDNLIYEEGTYHKDLWDVSSCLTKVLFDKKYIT